MDLDNGEEMRADSPEALMYDIICNEHNYTPKSCDTVLDIGAHHGFFALFCALRGASVLAYEPDPDNFKELQKKIAIVKELKGCPIIAQQAAVWSESGERLLWLDPRNSGANSMVLPCSEVSFMVKTVGLTEALGAAMWDCVKCDVEGAEVQIFLSAKAADYRHIRFLTMELHNHILTREQHHALLLRLKREFPRVEERAEIKEGLPTGRTAAVFCWSDL